MPNIEEIYDNVEVFISNLEILLTKNIFKGKFQQEVKNFGTELYKLCKDKQFNIDSSEILSMPSFVDLFYHTPKKSQGYLISYVERFYYDILETTKTEFNIGSDV